MCVCVVLNRKLHWFLCHDQYSTEGYVVVYVLLLDRNPVHKGMSGVFVQTLNLKLISSFSSQCTRQTSNLVETVLRYFNKITENRRRLPC